MPKYPNGVEFCKANQLPGSDIAYGPHNWRTFVTRATPSTTPGEDAVYQRVTEFYCAYCLEKRYVG